MPTTTRSVAFAAEALVQLSQCRHWDKTPVSTPSGQKTSRTMPQAARARGT